MLDDSDEPVEIIELVADLETWNSHQVRFAAVEKLAKLGINSRLVIDALSRLAKESYNELGKSAAEAIDLIYMSGRMKASPARKVMTTQVHITPATGPGLEVECTKAYCRCNFCGKETLMTSASRRFTERLSGPERFYCTFCLRHRLNQKDARHTLVLSFRGIIGYYYNAFHLLSKNVHMTISEIWDHVHLHAQVGTQNPLFVYDPDSFLWFVDFTRVGNTTRKMPIKDVLGTVAEILLSFNLMDNVKDIKPSKMYLKYEEAILKFYHQRTRPANMRVLAPTLKLTGASDYAADKLAKETHNTTVTPGNEKRRIPIDETRNFLPQVLHDALGKKY